MQSKETLRHAIESSVQMTLPLLEDLRDAPLAFPTAHGGNHAMWIAGHMAHSAGHLLWQMMRGEANPLSEWNELFGGRTQPHDDAEKYPAYDDVLAKFQQIHDDVLTLLESMSEDQLDQTSHSAPEGFEAFFGTYRRCFLTLSLHLANHRGQLAVCRTALGRTPLMA